MNRLVLNILMLLALVFLGSAGCAKRSIPQKTAVKQEALDFNYDFSKYRPKIDMVQSQKKKVRMRYSFRTGQFKVLMT